MGGSVDASAIFIPIQYRSKCVICLVDDDPVSAGAKEEGGGIVLGLCAVRLGQAGLTVHK